VSKLNDEPCLKASDFIDAGIEQGKDSKTELLRGVSSLQLCLLIAMKRLQEKEIVPYNFEMVYDEFYKFALKTENNDSIDCYRKPVALKVKRL
jgi:origin recognition complex subunit 4